VPWVYGQQQPFPSPSSPNPEGEGTKGEWIAFDRADQETISRAMQRIPILEGEIESYKRKIELDNQEISLLNDKLALAAERLEVEKERVKVAEERASVEKERAAASAEAYAAERSLVQEYKDVIRSQDKQIFWSKLFGAGGFLAGVGIAVLVILSTL
jgi:hypothetical protein